MHIAHFIQRYPPALGGSEAYFARLGRYLAGEGSRVTVFTSNAIDLEAFWTRRGIQTSPGSHHDAGVQVRRYPLARWPGRRYLLKALSLLPHRLWQCLTLPCNPVCLGMWRDAGRIPIRYDAVHASAFPYAWPIACAWRLARRQNIPLLLTPFLHLGDPDDWRDPTRRRYLAPPLVWLLRQSDAIFVQTPSERRAVLELGIPPDRVVLQGLGVDPAECRGGKRDDTRRRWGVPENAVVIGHLANQSREKGTIDLLAALRLLWEADVPAHVVLAGPEMANFRAFWESFVVSLPVAWQTRIHRLGVLTSEEKRDFFAGIDVFALPSRSDSFGLVLLEAWTNGVPNVAYRAGGVADLIQHRVDGSLVSCGDVPALAGALRELIRAPELRRRLGQSGRARVAHSYQWGDKLALVQHTLRGLLAAPLAA
jgi:glycosyltransferase involved in cell wall biosynthesis